MNTTGRPQLVIDFGVIYVEETDFGIIEVRSRMEHWVSKVSKFFSIEIDGRMISENVFTSETEDFPSVEFLREFLTDCRSIHSND